MTTSACRSARSHCTEREQPLPRLRHLGPLHRRRRDDRRQSRACRHCGSAWIAARGDVEADRGRAVRAGGQWRRRACAPRARLPGAPAAARRAAGPARHPARIGAGPASSPRRWSMSRIARISDAQRAGRRGRSAARRRRELRRLAARLRHAGVRARARSRAAAPSSPPISITPSSSR